MRILFGWWEVWFVKVFFRLILCLLFVIVGIVGLEFLICGDGGGVLVVSYWYGVGNYECIY